MLELARNGERFLARGKDRMRWHRVEATRRENIGRPHSVFRGAEVNHVATTSKRPTSDLFNRVARSAHDAVVPAVFMTAGGANVRIASGWPIHNICARIA